MPEKSYPKQYESSIKLNDEVCVFIRPIKKTDRPLIFDLFNRLSDRTKYLRFLRNYNYVPEDMLSRLADVDYNTSFALIALVRGQANDSIISVARYAYSKEGDYADLAVTVRDDWQNKGLGTAMLKRIFEIGLSAGITRYRSMIEPQNRVIMHILSKLGCVTHYSTEGEVFSVEIHTQPLK